MTKPLPNIQDIYPLTPTQQGMLFHTLLAPEPGVYVVQAVLTLVGDMDGSTLQRAWQRALDRYEALRSLFVWKGQEKPLQIVPHQVVLPWEQLDWLGLSATDQQAKLESFLGADRDQGFDLSKAPLMRVTLIRTAENRHELIWTTHHLLLDGWSTFLVIKDVVAMYRALRQGRELHLPHCRPYRDYIGWLQRQDLSKAEAFWRAELKDFNTPTPLGADRPALILRGHRDDIASEQQLWPAELTRALRTFGARHNLTVSTLVHGAWAVLLSRYSGEASVLFGSVVSGRPAELAGVESMVGLFINTLPVLARISPAASVLSWLKAFQDQLIALQQYEHSSLVDIQGWSEVRRDQPLFESLLAFENYRVDATLSQRDTDLEIADVRGIEQTNYPLAVTVAPGEELFVKVDYSVNRFDAATITRLFGHFRALLEGMVSNPNQCVSDLPLLTDRERHHLLVEWNDTDADYPADALLHELFEAQAGRRPEQVAVVFEDQTLTYGELNRRANHLAHHLRALGVGPEGLVGLFVERSLEMVVGLLGILKAGAAYVPMDPSFPADRLTYMMNDAGIAQLVTQTSLLGRLPESEGKAICLDAEWERIQQEESENPHVPVGPSTLAYTIYTSGSTGKPKGVMIEHRSVVNFVLSMQQEPGFDETDVLVGVTTISFDIAALEMFLPLISGGKLVLASRNEAIDGSRLLQLIERSGATTLQATPATWKLMMEAGWKNAPGLKMLCGGEALPRELANRMLERGGELWNMYGPTETTIWSAVRRIEPGPDPVLIGRPIANTQFYIVDKELEPVPIGVVGELLIGGDGLSRGYLNRPELTAERFIENPFPGSGGRLYRTGDLARFRSDGAIEFLGRLDFQVKVRGYRIELGEIEYGLTQHAGVKDAVVMTCEEPDSDKRLVAYYIPATDKPLNVEDLRRALQEKLPPYMIPSTFMRLETFPLTANGKVDRKALPAPDERLVTVARESVAPRDPLEQALAGMWCKILKAKRVGIHDSFFDLGGHSLTAIRLLSDVQKLTGKTLPLAILFQASTVAALADILRRDGWTPSWSSLVPIHAGGSKHPLFLVHAAHGNVLLYRQVANYLGPDQPVYGLQSKGLNGDGPFTSTLEEMASQYVKEIVTVQPHGPYFIGGYCLGGMIALEIAQQLTTLGEKVEVVILLDTYNVTVVSRSKPLLCVPVYWLQNLWFHVANSVSVRGKDRGKFLREKVDIAMTRLGIRLRAGWHAAKGLGGTKKLQNDPLLAVKRVNDEAASRYVPKPYGGRVALIRSKGYFVGFANPSFGWSDIVRDDLVIHELPVYPRGMLIEPFCRLLADTINAEIEKAACIREETAFATIRGRVSRQPLGQVSLRAQTHGPDLMNLDTHNERQSLPAAPAP